MLILSIDKASAVPVYEQIRDRVVGLVDSGALTAGDRLPPTRVLARTVGVHRSTVLRAYGELWALGYLESRPGSYSTVRRPARPTAVGRPGSGTVIDWEHAATAAANGAVADASRLDAERVTPPGVIDFSRLSADRSLTPADDVRRCFKAVLLEQGRELLDYGEAAGYGPLRETIARQMRVHGVAVSADEILVTNGAQHGIDLAVRMLTRRGDRAIVESPSYGAALSLFRLHGLSIEDVPMRPDGMDLDALEAALERERAAFVYTIPNFHNPTGITTGQKHRERLLTLCEARRVPVVEDGFEEDMKYFGKAVLPIKSMDANGVVLYVGTFSKVVFPGLRVGWIAAPREALARLVAVQRVSSLTGNSLAQAMVARFCSLGLYDAHLRRVHKVYRRRMQAMLKGLAEHMPPGVEWTQPTGGYTLWVRAGASREDERAFHDRLLRDGVKVSAGSFYFRAAPQNIHFRLSIACLSEAQIAEGCRRLGRSLASAHR